MNITDFTNQARTLMDTHNLHHVPLELDRGRKRMGACHVRTTTVNYRQVSTAIKVTFSRHFVELLEWDELEDIVLHEIAHSLTPGSNHDYAFMSKCREIGAVPARCKSASARPEYTVTANCPECGKQLAGQFRLPTRIYVCKNCRVDGDKVILVWYRKGHRVAFESMPRDYQSRVNWYNNRRK